MSDRIAEIRARMNTWDMAMPDTALKIANSTDILYLLAEVERLRELSVPHSTAAAYDALTAAVAVPCSCGLTNLPPHDDARHEDARAAFVAEMVAEGDTHERWVVDGRALSRTAYARHIAGETRRITPPHITNIIMDRYGQCWTACSCGWQSEASYDTDRVAHDADVHRVQHDREAQ